MRIYIANFASSFQLEDLAGEAHDTDLEMLASPAVHVVSTELTNEWIERLKADAEEDLNYAMDDDDRYPELTWSTEGWLEASLGTERSHQSWLGSIDGEVVMQLVVQAMEG